MSENQEKKTTKINVFNPNQEEDRDILHESFESVSSDDIEEESNSYNQHEKLNGDSTGIIGKFKELLDRKSRLKKTSTLAHVICNYSYYGQSVEEIASLLKIDKDIVIGCVQEAKDNNVYEKLALEYDFN